MSGEAGNGEAGNGQAGSGEAGSGEARSGGEPEVRTGAIEPELADELPGLRLLFTVIPARAGRSPASVRARLRDLSDGTRGGGVVALRTHAIPQAYRSLFRQIGLDPDVVRPPAEQAAVERLLAGRHEPHGMPQDALRIAVLETRVGCWALDADRVEETSFGIRVSRNGEQMISSGVARELPAGRLVVADERCVHALLFGDIGECSAVARPTRRMVLYTVGAPGVPEIHLHEAIWTAADLLQG